jgi:hypothetical protein
MSTWMSIGFDPDQMDPVTEPKAQAAISETRDEAAPRQTGGLDQVRSASSEPSGA